MACEASGGCSRWHARYPVAVRVRNGQQYVTKSRGGGKGGEVVVNGVCQGQRQEKGAEGGGHGTRGGHGTWKSISATSSWQATQLPPSPCCLPTRIPPSPSLPPSPCCCLPHTPLAGCCTPTSPRSSRSWSCLRATTSLRSRRPTGLGQAPVPSPTSHSMEMRATQGA